jgi:hypothetical protein
LCGSVHIIKKNTETLAAGSKEMGIEVNADTISTWLCLEIRMKDEVIISKLIIFP